MDQPTTCAALQGRFFKVLGMQCIGVILEKYTVWVYFRAKKSKSSRNSKEEPVLFNICFSKTVLIIAHLLWKPKHPKTPKPQNPWVCHQNWICSKLTRIQVGNCKDSLISSCNLNLTYVMRIFGESSSLVFVILYMLWNIYILNLCLQFYITLSCL